MKYDVLVHKSRERGWEVGVSVAGGQWSWRPVEATTKRDAHRLAPAVIATLLLEHEVTVSTQARLLACQAAELHEEAIKVARRPEWP